jgi:hypothetical protein
MLTPKECHDIILAPFNSMVASLKRGVALPFSVLSCDEQNCVLNASREKFDSAPTFVSEDDLAEPRLAENIYRYFGL